MFDIESRVSLSSYPFTHQLICLARIFGSGMTRKLQQNYTVFSIQTKNKPAAQAAGADPSRCNFTTRKNLAGPVKLPIF